MTVAIVFVDRDGVLNQLVVDRSSGKPESPYRAEDVLLMPEAVAGLQALQRLELPVVVVSNQPAAAKGTTTLEHLHEVHQAVEDRLREAGVDVAAYRYCFHHPEGTDPVLGVACDCRKPATGMLLDAASELGVASLAASWVIGDSDVDILAGRAVGAHTILIEEPASAHRRGNVEPEVRAADLAEAADIVAAAVASMGVSECSTR
jgi:D-glycero-D-manno-heptose 1,7-bisphosphate phosphatase